jgi:hypothetical protein
MNEVNTNKIVPTKTKSTAVILAVLFGVFAWLYTHKKNIGKFIIAMVVWMFLLITYMGMSDLVIGGLVLMLIWVWNVATYIWVIVDNATKPDSFYENYPK